MKKFLLSFLALSLSACGADAAFNYLGAPNEGNRDFAPLSQYQFEKKESLDFLNNSEEYREKREQRDRYLDYQEGKVDVPANVKMRYNMQDSTEYARPGSNNMQFYRDENGKLRIKAF